MFAARITGCLIRAPVSNILVQIRTGINCNITTVTPVRSYKAGRRLLFRRPWPIKNIRDDDLLGKGLKRRVGPMEVGQIAVAGGAALGLGAICYYGLGLANEPGAIDRMAIWPDYVRARIKKTYTFFGTTVLFSAGAAYAIYSSPMAYRYFNFCQRHPIMSTVGLIAGLMATGQAMMSLPYTQNISAKHLLWIINCGMIGLAVCPVGFVGGAIVRRAGFYTAGIMGGLSTVAMCAPSEKFLNWGGPLALGLGGVIAASLGSAIFPATSTLGLNLYSISLYGGLLLFSAFLLYDTQKIIHKAESHPHEMYGLRPYDPINASHHLVMDTVNIFVRIAQILAMGGGSRKK